MQAITDICVNPTAKEYRDDWDDVMRKTKALNVSCIFASSGLHDLVRTIELAEKYDQKCTIGFHPHWANPASEWTSKQFLIDNMKSSKIVAIGECGLDYNRMRSPKDCQLYVFRMQMEVAEKYGYPVLLHSRDAHDDFMKVVRDYPKVRGVVHCFTGTEAELQDYLNHGFYIGFTTLICQNGKRGKSIRSMLLKTPLDRIMLETDAPYMIPPVSEHDSKLLRGRRNEPWTIQYALKTAADVLEMKRDVLSSIVQENVNRLFQRLPIIEDVPSTEDVPSAEENQSPSAEYLPEQDGGDGVKSVTSEAESIHDQIKKLESMREEIKKMSKQLDDFGDQLKSFVDQKK